MLWAYALGVCFGHMFWADVLGVCFGRLLSVYGFRADVFGSITLGTWFWVYVFGRIDFAEETRSKVLNRQSQSVQKLIVM